MKRSSLDLFSNEEEIEKEEKLSSLDELFTKSLSYKQSDKYFELLKFITYFPKLSPFNAFLIYTQNPGVKIVMTETKWRLKYNRRPIPYAKPLVILVPFGPVRFVYDLDNTEDLNPAKPFPIPDSLLHPFATPGNLNPDIYYHTLDSCKKHKIIVKENTLANIAAGYARFTNNIFRININNKWCINEKYSTLIHELGHIFSGHLGINSKSWWRNRKNLDREICEIEAESISYLVCIRNRLKTTSDKYLSDYITKHPELPHISLDTIISVSGYIESMKERTFKPRKPTKTKK